MGAQPLRTTHIGTADVAFSHPPHGAWHATWQRWRTCAHVWTVEFHELEDTFSAVPDCFGRLVITQTLSHGLAKVLAEHVNPTH
jgi:hypothetical protein